METQDVFYDEGAVAIVSAIRQAIRRLRLPGETQAQFMALLNAIEVQVEVRQAAPTALHHLCQALLALADARGLDRTKLELDQRLEDLRKSTTRTR